MNLALRGGGWPFGLEKWYVDTLLPDGTVLLVYLVRIRVLGLPVTRLTAELFRPGGPDVRGEAVVRSVSGGEDRLWFGPARIEGEVLRWETPGLSGELRFVPRAAPVALVDPFLEASSRRLTWTVEVPDADVTGRVVWPGGELEVTGRGYRDRVWFDLLPWRFPIRELVWGRAVAGPHAATWVRATTPTGEVAARWQDGVVELGSARPVDLGPSRTLLETRVADIEGFRLGWLAPLLRRVTGDPHEIKLAAPCELDGEAGVAVHEVVGWGR